MSIQDGWGREANLYDSGSEGLIKMGGVGGGVEWGTRGYSSSYLGQLGMPQRIQ